jgi:hypothetical protein
MVEVGSSEDVDLVNESAKILSRTVKSGFGFVDSKLAQTLKNRHLQP